MKDGTSHSITLESAKVKFLEDMVTQHGLPDTNKAIRCLIDYARANPDRQKEIFAEFRCHDCG